MTPLAPPRVYLTGFMGAGKSTVALHLAGRIGWTFIDHDKLVGALAGRSAADLFAESEAVFREHERATLRKTYDKRRIVVATGGGALVQPGAMDEAKAAGTVIYLRLTPGRLVARLREGAASRPLLHDDSGVPLAGDALRERVETLLGEREVHYEQAHHTVDADAAPYDLAKDIAEMLIERYSVPQWSGLG